MGNAAADVPSAVETFGVVAGVAIVVGVGVMASMKGRRVPPSVSTVFF